MSNDEVRVSKWDKHREGFQSNALSCAGRGVDRTTAIGQLMDNSPTTLNSLFGASQPIGAGHDFTVGLNTHCGHKPILNSSDHQNINAPRIQISHPDIIPNQVVLIWLLLPSEYGSLSCVFCNDYSVNRRACDTMPWDLRKPGMGSGDEVSLEKGRIQLHEKTKYFLING